VSERSVLIVSQINIIKIDLGQTRQSVGVV